MSPTWIHMTHFNMNILRKVTFSNFISRLFSINKFHLIETSLNIEKIIEKNHFQPVEEFTKELRSIHEEYQDKSIAVSTKLIYRKNSSIFNSIYLRLESDRNEQIHFFNPNSSSRLILLLKYIRFLQISSIYQFITLDIQQSSFNTSKTILQLIKDHQSLPDQSPLFICELCFFVKYLLNVTTLEETKNFLSKTSIDKYLFDYLRNEKCFLFIEELCSTLYSIQSFPIETNLHELSLQLLQSLHQHRSTSMKIFRYLQYIQHQSKNLNSNEIFSLLNEYLLEVGIHENNLNNLCYLLIYLSSLNYSHEVFLENLLKKLSKNNLDQKYLCRFIYYLCLLDPTNSFHSRTILVQLTRQINESLHDKPIHSQWIIQSQYGLMCRNIYQYQLLFQILQKNYFPKLFSKKFLSSNGF